MISEKGKIQGLEGTESRERLQEKIVAENRVGDEIKESEKNLKENIKNLQLNKSDLINQEKEFLDILKIFSPGTTIRAALDDILKARFGALIVVEKEGLSNIIEGGFRINSKFSSQKLFELSKMDGAIILSKDMKKILYANTLLIPSAKIYTKETGSRHKAAERTAKQLGTIVIAVSEKRNKTTLYYKNEIYHLENTSEILRRASETLQILEKQVDVLNDLLSHLNILEITNLTSMSDVCSVLQNFEMVRRVSESIKKYLIELGKEGIIVSTRFKELTRNITQERERLFMDYFGSKYKKVDYILKNMSFDFLLDNQNILRIVFEELHDGPISPKGIRILSKTNLLDKDIKILVENFKILDRIFNLDKEDLKKIFKNENFIDSLLIEIKNLKEKILMGKKV